MVNLKVPAKVEQPRTSEELKVDEEVVLETFPTRPEFNFKKLLSILRYVSKKAQTTNRLEYDAYVSIYTEFLKLMLHLGPYVSMGFKDLQSKADFFINNRQLFNAKYGMIKQTDDAYKYINDFCKFETMIGIQEMNETENKRVFKEALRMADKQKPY